MKFSFRKNKLRCIALLCSALLISGCGQNGQATESPAVMEAKVTIDLSAYRTDTDYFYNMMNDDEKLLYDALKSESEKIYWGEESPKIIDFNGIEKACYGDIDIGKLNQTQAAWIMTLFYYSCPKYFFISDEAYFGNVLCEKDGKYYIKLYKDFDTPEAIAEYREQLEEKTEEVVSLTKDISDDYDKEMFIISWITDNLYYDYDVYEKSKILNSTYSDAELEELNDAYFYASNLIGLLNGNTICAGYAKITQYLLNAAGIETLLVPSNTHGYHVWNMVKLYDDWYCLDTTWLDSGINITPANKSLNKSYETFKDLESAESSHLVDGQFQNNNFKLPDCKNDIVKGQPELYTGVDEGFKIENGILTEYTGTNADVIIPSTVAQLDVTVLNKDTQIMSISVDENNPYLCSVDGVLFSKDMETLIRYPSLVKGDYTVPEGTKNIEDGAFFRNKEMTSVTFPEGTEIIRDGALCRCDSLETVNLPSSISYIGNHAFTNSDKLTTIYYDGSEEEWNAVYKDFADIPEGCNIVFGK
jgi:hypothetical protein